VASCVIYAIRGANGVGLWRVRQQLHRLLALTVAYPFTKTRKTTIIRRWSSRMK
jgi:hypothetical protein